MLPSAWDEFARLQQLACRPHIDNNSWTVEEQLDEFLEMYPQDLTPFNLHDCRRRLKNLARNRARKLRRRVEALRREAPWLVRPAAPDPFEETAKKDQLARVKERVSPDEWRMLYGVAAGDYATVARHLGMAVGTLKALVSRCRLRLRDAS
jgi:hypothetical protein